VQKEAILPNDLRPAWAYDRSILLLGYAGGLRRSEIVSLDFSKDDTPDSCGWIEVPDEGALLTLNAKTGWRKVEIDERYIQKQLGHAPAEMTRRYQLSAGSVPRQPDEGCRTLISAPFSVPVGSL
jgi:integrase